MTKKAIETEKLAEAEEFAPKYEVSYDNVISFDLGNGNYDHQFMDYDAYVKFYGCHESSRGLLSTVSIFCPINHAILSHIQFNLYSQKARRDLALDLAKGYQEKYIPWDQILEYAITDTINKIKTPPELANIDAQPEEERIEYLLDPLLPKNRPTTLFSPGGKGKSIVADYLAVLVAHGVCANGGLPFIPTQANVLYMDWEDEGDTHKRYITAIEKDLGLPHGTIYYMDCDKPFNYYIEHIRNLIKKHDIGLVIIDSQMAATAQNPHGMTEAQIASDYYNNIKSLKCTTLTLDHVTKQNMNTSDSTTAPYGSIVKYNRSRSQWELKQTQQVDEDVIEIALNHTKYNIGKLKKAIGIRVKFENDGDRLLSMSFSHCDIASNPDLEVVLPLKYRIRAALGRDGTLSISELADQLSKSEATIKTTLNRDKKMFTKVGEKWGNLFNED